MECEGAGRGPRFCYLLLNRGTDIGHVDFLEKVHGLAERPYVIAGLHFDQVSLPGQRIGCGARGGSWGGGWVGGPTGGEALDAGGGGGHKSGPLLGTGAAPPTRDLWGITALTRPGLPAHPTSLWP